MLAPDPRSIRSACSVPLQRPIRALALALTLSLAASMAPTAGAQGLLVSPSGGAAFAGSVGGGYQPSQVRYTLSNTGLSSVSYYATKTQPWLLLSKASGTLSAVGQTTIDLSIDAAVADALGAGTYSATVSFFNLSNASSESRTVTLSVAPGGILAVTPADDLIASGPLGGPFLGDDLWYTLENVGTASLEWSVSTDESWCGVDPPNDGVLDPGDSIDLKAYINDPKTIALGLGDHSAQISFRDETQGLVVDSRQVQLSLTPPATAIEVLPSTGMVSSGPVGGPFVPDEETYSLKNIGTSPLTWSVSDNASWVRLSATGGTLNPGAQVNLIVMIDQQVASTLASGSYAASVFIDDVTGGTPSIVRTVQLDVLSSAVTLSVSPSGTVTSSGPAGGPFSPTSHVYTLQNLATQSVAWSVSGAPSWLTLSSTGGTLSPGAQASVTATIQALNTNGFAPGTFSTSLAFQDLTNGGAAQSRKLQLVVQGSGVSSASSITQHGITWTFDRSYPVGNYANGDWWVEGPVTIESISPNSIRSAGRVMHGSMVNPDPNSQSQGYDNTMYAQYAWSTSYKDSLNVALDLSPSNPLVLAAGNSLISTISIATPDQRPQLYAAAILTVVPFAPAAGSFRPPYCGTDKTSEFNESQLDYAKLERFPIVAGTPSIDKVANYFTRPWIDHIPDWIGRYIHPAENMPDYGREICDRVSSAALMLHLDYTDAEKRDLLVRFVQLGIDNFGIVETGGGKKNWPAGGGHHSGRKWPILFAGIMLTDIDMAEIGFDDDVAFNEDDQTFYVAETSPGVYNCGYGGYDAGDVGLAEWGNQHWKSKTQDDKTWFGNGYRACCTAHVWWGQLLAARIMGAQVLWNDDVLFDYQDRYRVESVTNNSLSWQIAVSQWHLDMWDLYRPVY